MVDKTIQAIQQHSIPITNFKDDLGSLVTTIRDQKYILLGESSHGTLSSIKFDETKLIEEKDFTFIAVEGDWPAGE